MKHHSRKLKRIIRECFEDGIQDVIAPEQMALLTFEEIVDIIMLTVAAMKSEEVFISEGQKEKDKRRISSKGHHYANYTSPKQRMYIRR